MPAADVVELIKSDHQEVERLLDLLKNQPATRSLNFPVLCALLIAHSRAEEAEVYLVAKEEAERPKRSSTARENMPRPSTCLEEMTVMDAESAEFEAALDELTKAVNHHVEEGEQSTARDAAATD